MSEGDKVKRIIDVLASATGLVFTAPVMAGTALAIFSSMGRPVLFRQPRPGKDGQIFELVKFRTMCLPDRMCRTDAERLTPLGRFLRSTSVDELPTLWNVLRGDMSLVGPRPLLVEYLDRYTPEEARRHAVRPGVTGLAQVSGRNALTWEAKLALDVRYVDTRTLQLDFKILLQTLSCVIRREGISADGEATMPIFRGTTGAKAGATDGHA